MSELYRKTEAGEKLLLSDLMIAENVIDRGVGLLKLSSLSNQQGLWINPCNNIHTFFMRFSIDCIFIDREMKIKKIKKDIKPFRFRGPYFGAKSVIEVCSGFSDLHNLNVGDLLYVVR